MKSTETVNVRKLDLIDGKDELVREEAALETPITIYVDSECIATLFATPNAQRELAIGYLLGEGILRSYSDVEAVTASEDATSVHVRTKPGTNVRTDTARVVRVLTSACGSVEDFVRLLDRVDKPLVRSDYRVRAPEIMKMMREFNEHSLKYRKIGSFQYAAAFSESKMNAFFEDVGRHNAIDKVLGALVTREVDCSRIVLVSSGRQTAAEVMKAARIGIPVVVSIRGPIYSGILAASKTGVTLCCFARGQRMNIYSHFERVISD